MPHLYRLDAPAADIAAHFAARAGADPWAGGHVAAGQFAPVITAGREFIAGPRPAGKRLEARMIPRIWGVPPPPSAHDRSRGLLVVRNPDSPFWIGNLRNSEFRCLVPATAFIEWSRDASRDGKRRQCRFAPTDQSLFAMAGVWTDSEVPSFALVMCEANALLREQGYDAMPAILPPGPQAQQIWLHGGWDRAQALLAPYPSSLMREI